MEKQEKIKNEFDDCLVDNDDYFFRDSEMYRVDLVTPQHQVDPTFDVTKRIFPKITKENEEKGMD